MSAITDTHKHACARRELKMRRAIYPGWVARGRISQEAADHELACMASIVADYAALSAQENPPEPDLFSKP